MDSTLANPSCRKLVNKTDWMMVTNGSKKKQIHYGGLKSQTDKLTICDAEMAAVFDGTLTIQLIIRKRKRDHIGV